MVIARDGRGTGSAWLVVALLCLSCSAGGGAGGEADESVEMETSELGTSCASATPFARYPLGYDFHSPQSYNPADCFKGIVLHSDNSAGISPPATPVIVIWDDVVPTTEASCTQAVVRGYRFHFNTVTNWTTDDAQVAYGVWLGSTCQVPYVRLDGPNEAAPMRVAFSAKPRDSSSAPTRKVRAIFDRKF